MFLAGSLSREANRFCAESPVPARTFNLLRRTTIGVSLRSGGTTGVLGSHQILLSNRPGLTGSSMAANTRGLGTDWKRNGADSRSRRLFHNGICFTLTLTMEARSRRLSKKRFEFLPHRRPEAVDEKSWTPDAFVESERDRGTGFKFRRQTGDGKRLGR